MNTWKEPDKFAKAAAALLRDRGMLTQAETATAEKLLSDLLEPDYIPKGVKLGCVGDDYENVRPSAIWERCAQERSYDDQSGPVYCGDPAAVVADVTGMPGAYVIMCRRCWTKHRRKLPAELVG